MKFLRVFGLFGGIFSLPGNVFSGFETLEAKILESSAKSTASLPLESQILKASGHLVDKHAESLLTVKQIQAWDSKMKDFSIPKKLELDLKTFRRNGANLSLKKLKSIQLELATFEDWRALRNEIEAKYDYLLAHEGNVKLPLDLIKKVGKVFKSQRFDVNEAVAVRDYLLGYENYYRVLKEISVRLAKVNALLDKNDLKVSQDLQDRIAELFNSQKGDLDNADWILYDLNVEISNLRLKWIASRRSVLQRAKSI